jgi:hypothetical protein
MSFDRTAFAAALAKAIEVELDTSGVTATVFAKPPFTLNAPSIVIGRPSEVRYNEVAFSIDMATVPVTVVAGADQDETAAELIGVVRSAIAPDSATGEGLGAVVQTCQDRSERNWAHVNVSGTDLLRADVVLEIQM